MRFGTVTWATLALSCAVAGPLLAEPAARSLQDKAIENSGEVANYLVSERRKGEDLLQRLTAARPAEIRGLVETARLNGVEAATVVSQTLHRMPRPETQAQAQAEQQQVIDGVTALLQSIDEFQPYLQKVRTDLQTAEPAETVPRLASLAVPQGVVNILAPQTASYSRMEELPGAATQPRGVLTPFVIGLDSSTTVDYPSVGALIVPLPDFGPASMCTGTLIAPDVVLTAQHCVALPVSAVYFQHAGFFGVRDIAPLAGYQYPYPHNDIALIFLKQPVSGITPATLNDVKRSAPDLQGRIVGYGRRKLEPGEPQNWKTHFDSLNFTGLKLRADAKTTSCDSRLSIGSDRSDVICSLYYSMTGFRQPKSTICMGDSGGPLFAATATDLRLVGVASGGWDCQPGQYYLHVEVFDHIRWIRSEIARRQQVSPAPTAPAQQVASLHPIENGLTRFLVPLHFSVFSEANWDRSFRIDAPAAFMRVGMNANQRERNLKLVVTPPGSTAPCKIESAGTFSACNFVNPPQGAWQILITGTPQQEFQVVVTEFR